MAIIDSRSTSMVRTRRSSAAHRAELAPDPVTGDEMVAAMDAVGVDGAIFISAFPCTADASYAVRCNGPSRPVRPRQTGRPDNPAVAGSSPTGRRRAPSASHQR